MQTQATLNYNSFQIVWEITLFTKLESIWKSIALIKISHVLLRFWLHIRTNYIIKTSLSKIDRLNNILHSI